MRVVTPDLKAETNVNTANVVECLSFTGKMIFNSTNYFIFSKIILLFLLV